VGDEVERVRKRARMRTEPEKCIVVGWVVEGVYEQV